MAAAKHQPVHCQATGRPIMAYSVQPGCAGGERGEGEGRELVPVAVVRGGGVIEVGGVIEFMLTSQFPP